MPATYEPIATTTLGSAATDITFSSIPATYTDVRVVLTGTSPGAVTCTLRFNSDSSALYSNTTLRGNGTTASSGSSTGGTGISINAAGFSSTNPSFITCDVFSYAGSTNKTCLITCSSDYNGSGETERRVGLYRSTSAITTITFNNTSDFSAGTTATLFGIKAA
jgi:hypothetical protein